MKKLPIIVSISIVLLVTLVLVFIYFYGFFYQPSGQQLRFMAEIDAANSIIWYYGKPDPGKEVSINYKKISNFTEETIGDPNRQYVYHAIIIFDFDGKMNVSNEELLLIKKYCENEYYDCLYYGTAHLEQFRECGFFTQLDSSECGFTYNGSYWINKTVKEEYFEPYSLTGNWSVDDNERYNTNDKHIIWKFAIDYIVELINTSVKGG